MEQTLAFALMNGCSNSSLAVGLWSGSLVRQLRVNFLYLFPYSAYWFDTVARVSMFGGLSLKVRNMTWKGISKSEISVLSFTVQQEGHLVVSEVNAHKVVSSWIAPIIIISAWYPLLSTKISLNGHRKANYYSILQSNNRPFTLKAMPHFFLSN